MIPDVLGKIRTVMKAKQDGICINRVRKAKDRKVIVSCRSEEERGRVRNKLKTAVDQLDVQDVKTRTHSLSSGMSLNLTRTKT